MAREPTKKVKYCQPVKTRLNIYLFCIFDAFKFHAKEVGQGFFFFFNDEKIPKLDKMDRLVYYLGDSFPLGDFFFFTLNIFKR